jgi:hypothetical protein
MVPWSIFNVVMLLPVVIGIQSSCRGGASGGGEWQLIDQENVWLRPLMYPEERLTALDVAQTLYRGIAGLGAEW